MAHEDGKPKKHLFAVCAYGESPYLTACLKSLRLQSVPSEIIVCTSTPCEAISEAAERFAVPLHIRDGMSSLKDDWNFAFETAVREYGASFVTLCHQDDLYGREYKKEFLSAIAGHPDFLLFCTDAAVIDDTGKEKRFAAWRIKRLLRLPLRLRPFSGRALFKRLPLVFGNGIICPSCTYNAERTGLPLFENDDRFCIDWKTLLRLAALPGKFLCTEKKLIRYRVHRDAETYKNISDHTREREETEVFSSIWPAPFAKLLMRFYRKSYQTYNGSS